MGVAVGCLEGNNMLEKGYRIWFSAIVSSLINLLFGFGIGYEMLAVIFLVSQTFPSEKMKDYIDIGIFALLAVLIWGGLCFGYNSARYRRVQEGQLSYKQAGFYCTLLLPILLVISGMVIFMTKI